MTEYSEFLLRKRLRSTQQPVPVGTLPGCLFNFQRDLVTWALDLGRAALFADCGLGKTGMQLAWADSVRQAGGRTLILAPLAVAQQTVGEGVKFGVSVDHCRDGSSDAPIVIANYEMLHKFDPTAFDAVVLDESSILKNYSGKTRNQIIEAFAATKWKLACTATPSPNDHMELGNHSEFLGVLSRTEMLSMFFVHDGGETQKWRLKGHAEGQFWRWVSSWARVVRRPSDLGYDDGDFVLPPLQIEDLTVTAPSDNAQDRGFLFALEAQTLSDRRDVRRSTIESRARKCADMVNASDEPWLIWCDLNAEADAVEGMIPDSVQVSGSDDDDDKADRMLGFAAGRHRVLVTKASIAGFGMNWQHCRNVVFLGLSDSYEQFYQAVRRCWRFGQQKPVRCYVIVSDADGAVVRNIRRKAAAIEEMTSGMLSVEFNGERIGRSEYSMEQASGDGWRLYLGDCVDVARSLDDDSVGFSVFSPPFASLYTYSDSDRDMGNCRDHNEFMAHFRYLIPELLRVTKPGRLLSFHCMNLPTSKAHHGFIGLTDFRGILIRAFEEAGWIYHSEVCIWKDPVTAMQRTKALGLLHKQLKKDSCMSRQGIPDYLVTMRKPGDNEDRVSHTNETFPVGEWQQYASPVWMDINPSDTLQYMSAREEKDEKHICPLQLEVIRRALRLWSKPGDLVLSPFAGIGSEGVEALKCGRDFVGAELKRSYWDQARRNLEAATQQQSLPFAVST